MVNIHARADITVVQHPVAGRIEVDPDLRTINVPVELAAELCAIRVNGEPLWETEQDFDRHRAQAELERKRDPAMQALLLEKLVSLAATQAHVDVNTPIEATPAPTVPEVTVTAPDRAGLVADAVARNDYDVLSKEELRALAASRGLDQTGVKNTLITRLRDKDRGTK